MRGVALGMLFGLLAAVVIAAVQQPVIQQEKKVRWEVHWQQDTRRSREVWDSLGREGWEFVQYVGAAGDRAGMLPGNSIFKRRTEY